MQTNRLAEHLENPEVQRQILGAYRGPFALGITRDPDQTTKPAISLRIAMQSVDSLPQNIILDDEEIPIVRQGNFTAPSPQ